jgi:asparagine synthase (glutamine-hydrolysing)
MCGIAGFSGIGDQQTIQNMTRSISYRGPDAEGYWSEAEQGIFLGHRRLSILDLTGGAQPMCSVDGQLVVVFNGEIYNHKQLREQLEARGHRFKSHHSDTETLLYGYKEWGEELPQHLNGMWALAIYDRVKRRLFLSKDRFGKKPLYYSMQNGIFAFASELHALLAHEHMQKHISPLGLRKYFAYGFIPAPHTVYEQIHKLPGGYNLIYDLDKRQPISKPYWRFELEPEEPVSGTTDQWEEELREILAAAVERRLEADVPVGIFLSGGIDSTAITHFAVKTQGTKKTKTFSIGFEKASFDESSHSNFAAKLLGVEHHLEIMGDSQNIAMEVVDRLDEPFGDSSIIPTYLLCKNARKQVTVALGGDGADELFAGYDPFHALKLAQWYQRLTPRPVHAALRLLATRLPVSQNSMSLGFKINRTLQGLDHPEKLWNPAWIGPLAFKELEDFFNEPLDPEIIYSEAIEEWDRCKQPNIIDKTLQFFTRLYLPHAVLTKVDRASMLNSLEVRTPFLDLEMVDFVRRIPHRYKYHRGTTKYLLKKALEPELPKAILQRKKKGFGVPVGQWFYDGALAFSDSGAYPMKDQKRLLEHRAGSADHRLFLWNFWVLQRFLQQSDNAINS